MRRSTLYKNLHCRAAFKAEHALALKAQMRPFRTTGEDAEQIAKWREQYDAVMFRYSALWLWGASHMAKSRYMESLFPDAFWHKYVVN